MLGTLALDRDGAHSQRARGPVHMTPVSNQDSVAQTHRPIEPPKPAGLLALSIANLIHSTHEPTRIMEATPRDPKASIVQKLDDVAGQQPNASVLVRVIHGLRAWIQGVLLLGILVTGGAGALAAAGSLDVEGEKPANIFWLLGAVLGGQTLLLALWFLLLLFGGSVLRRWSIGGLLLGSAGWISTRLSSSGGSRGSSKYKLARAAASAVAEADLGGKRARWALGTITHLAWLTFNAGLLITLIAILSVRQFDFGWETTIGSDAFFEQAAEAIAIAPEWVGFDVPTPEQVESARIDPKTGELLGAGDEARRAFSGLLIGSVLIYGLAPRLLLFIACFLLWRHARRRWRPQIDAARFAALRRLTEPHAVRVDGVEFDVTDAGPEADLDEPPEDRQTVGSAIVGIELDTPACGWPPPSGAPVEDLGIIESREDRVATVRRLAHTPTLPARLVIVADLATTPDRGIGQSIELVRQAAEDPRIFVVLTGGERFRARVDAAQLDRRIADWHTLVESLGTDQRVQELDLDNLTAASRAQLSELVGGSARPHLPHQHGPIGGIDAAFAEIGAQVRRWHGPPGEKERLALHKAVARCAGAESGGLLQGIPNPHELAKNPRDAIERGANKIRALLPPRLAASGRWAAIGASVGALACLATAGTVAPAVLAALPVWLATGAASGAGLAMLGDSKSESAAAELAGALPEPEARGEAVAAAAMHAVVLAYQGRGERFIQEILESVFTGEPPALPDPDSVALALSRWRTRIDDASKDPGGP